ncbi:hypothetical protein HDU67_000878 [Dinochytrium kinnereticum]|nr:hypothetical protein HDU67_000878 [Dinochytrium kinnereticum]
MFNNALTLTLAISAISLLPKVLTGPVPSSLVGISDLQQLPTQSPEIRILEVGGSIYLAGPQVSWQTYYASVNSIQTLFTSNVGATVETGNIHDLSESLKMVGYSGEVWVAAFNGDTYSSTKTTNCMTLNVDTAFFRVYTDPINCKPDVQRPFLLTGYVGQMAVETFDLDGRLFQFLDFGVSYPIFELIADLDKDIIPASVDAHTLPQISSYLSKKDYKGTLWIGSWDGNTYNSSCMALTLPNTVNVYEGRTACSHLRPALFEVLKH